MGRRATGSWDETRGRWVARLGPVDPATGRKSLVALADEAGRPIAQGDRKGAKAAALRLAGGLPGAPGLTAFDVCRLYLEWQRDTGASQRTLDGLRGHLDRWCALVVGGRRVGQLPASAIRAEHVWAADAPGKARRNLYAAVLACWRWAHSPIKGRTPARLLEGANPLQGLARPSPGRRTVQIDGAALRRLRRLVWAWCRAPSRTRRARTRRDRRRKWVALAAMALFGLRTSEACGLRASEVRESARGVVVAIDPARDKRRRKGSAPDRPALYADVGPVPRRWLAIARALAPGGGRLVRVRPAELARWLKDDLRPYLAAHGLALPEGFTPYALRHSRINAAKRSGLTAERIADASGNSADALRRVYLHGTETDALDAAEAIRRGRR